MGSLSNPAASKFELHSATKVNDEARCHFHLLSNHDLNQLRPLLETILSMREEVVTNWCQAYLTGFGDERALSESELVEIFAAGLWNAQSALLAADIEKYESEIVPLAEMLAARAMSLEELMVSLQLFKHSAHSVLPDNLPQGLEAAFDRLSQIQVLLFVSAYSKSRPAMARTKIAAMEAEAARLPARERNRFGGLVGSSPSMRQLFERIELAGAASGNLLTIGDSGTGKELVARAIHDCGPRQGKPFIALNCAALPKDLIESELFGYKRGAFSGANHDHLGLFRAAEGGTLFLDEITEMDAATQSKLLRAIQERAIRPVGSMQELPVDVRVIASTNRDPRQAVTDGRLREDLYYRLQASVLNIPPLCERLEDIPLLVEHFIAIFNQRLGRTVAGIEQQALDAITAYSWPGNVRELSNVIEGAFTFGRASLIRLQDLPPTLVSIEGAQRTIPTLPRGARAPIPSFAETERDLIAHALESTRGNKVAAAAALGISRKKLYAKIAKYALAPGTGATAQAD